MGKGGGGGLAFLNKKSWHTGGMKQIEEVWRREAQAEAEKTKIEELQKQITEERKQEEIFGVAAASGHVERQDRLEFMYRGALAESQSMLTDDYLLGKEYKEEAKEETTVKLLESKQAPGSLFVDDTPKSMNEQWAAINNDPMLMMKQQEMQALAHVKKNPVKMAQIRREVEELKAKKKAKKEAKKEKKRAKKELKKAKKSAETGKFSEGGGEGGSDDSGSSPTASPEKEIPASESNPGNDIPSQVVSENIGTFTVTTTMTTSIESTLDTRASAVTTSRTSDPLTTSTETAGTIPEVRDTTTTAGAHHGNGAIRVRSAEETAARRRSARGTTFLGRSREPPRGSAAAAAAEPLRNDRQETGKAAGPKVHYGGGACAQAGGKSYGLDMSHMSEDLRIAKAEKMAAMKEERASKPRAKTPPKVVAAPRQPHRPGRLTEEEKAARLAAMQSDADVHEEARWERLRQAKIKDAKEESEQAENTQNEKASFLESAGKNMYGANQNSSLADTVNRRSWFRERGGGGDEKNAFRRH
eukprot:CAMPEP_0114235618 /NCGR_PEP_ID=MMETSP0058-20121206/6351_1 /TAXON_ID=36894 /ORGANISM="Pyramimonas parkeae, CCMP726" /LENGTH=528 /DNA_ID=CAMNT_0001347401 /DNA_START=110 /DNA_END=1698 /DNA_ORIENTATION=+